MGNLGEILQNAMLQNAKRREPLGSKVAISEAVPTSFVEIREKFCDYFENTAAYIDPDTIRVDGNYGVFRIKTLHEVIGMELLGSGCYASAYSSGGKVLKVINSEDDGYAAFIQFVKKEGHKYSCFPKIYYSGKWANKQVYILELLDTSAESEKDRKFASNIIRDFCASDDKEISRFFNSKQNDLTAGLTALRNFKANHYGYLCFDLHYGNMLIRKNGDIVIIDPFTA